MTTETNRGASAPSPPTQAAGSPAVPHRLILPIVLAGVFITTLDFFIVNVAIPSSGPTSGRAPPPSSGWSPGSAWRTASA